MQSNFLKKLYKRLLKISENYLGGFNIWLWKISRNDRKAFRKVHKA
jgi:hypothetical protein